MLGTTKIVTPSLSLSHDYLLARDVQLSRVIGKKNATDWSVLYHLYLSNGNGREFPAIASERVNRICYNLRRHRVELIRRLVAWISMDIK